MDRRSLRAQDWLCPSLRLVEHTPPVKQTYSPSKQSILDSNKTNKHVDEEIVGLSVKEAHFFRSDRAGEVLYWTLALITAGAFLIIVRWFPMMEARIRYRRSNIADVETDYVYCVSLDGSIKKCEISSIDPASKTPEWMPLCEIRKRLNSSNTADSFFEKQTLGNGSVGSTPFSFPFPRTFVWRSERFWYDSESMSYVRKYFDLKKSHEDVHRAAAKEALWSSGLCEYQSDNAAVSSTPHHFDSPVEFRRFIRTASYGHNTIHIESKSILTLIGEEAVKPFFIFQVFSMTAWIIQVWCLCL